VWSYVVAKFWARAGSMSLAVYSVDIGFGQSALRTSVSRWFFNGREQNRRDNSAPAPGMRGRSGSGVINGLHPRPSGWLALRWWRARVLPSGSATRAIRQKGKSWTSMTIFTSFDLR
jgi:hypothetical protein